VAAGTAASRGTFSYRHHEHISAAGRAI